MNLEGSKACKVLDRWGDSVSLRSHRESFFPLLSGTFLAMTALPATVSALPLQCGWLLTIANLGDSRAVLDTGAQILQLSVDHRVATHRAERHRLERTGALIAPIDVSGQPSLLSRACMTRLVCHYACCL